MTIRRRIANIVQQDHVNFLLTNRLPRRLVTSWMGRFSRIRNPALFQLSLRVWRLFTDIDLSEAQETQFASLHDCFTRRLKPGARPFEPAADIITSPCDGIVGAMGTVRDGQVLQVKGSAYALTDLLGDAAQADTYRDGCYVTLRLTSAMYHRFHAPQDCRVEHVAHFFGDAWNVNPPALARVDRLYCKNERAVIRTVLGSGHTMTLVPVAAILVAGIRLCFLDLSRARGKPGWTQFGCSAPLRKGDEMGWFEHGSTIIVFLPAGFELCTTLQPGMTLRAGEPLIRLRTPLTPA